MSGNSLSCLKGSRTLLGLRREGGISLETLQLKKASARVEGRISWFISSCRRVPLELGQGFQGPALGASGRDRLHATQEGPLRIPLQSLPWQRSSPVVKAGNSGFLTRAGMDFRVPLGRPQGSQASSPVEPCSFALLSPQKSNVRLPVGLTRGNSGFLSRSHRAFTPAIAF